MTTDTDRLITAWLQEGGSRDLDAERLEALFATTAATSQRRPMLPLVGPQPWPRRGPRIALGAPARAVALVALGALLLLALALAAAALTRNPDRARLLASIEADGVHLANADGTGDRLVLPGSFADLAWSPDGTHLAVAEIDNQLDVAVDVLDARGEVTGRIEPDFRGLASMPAWSPDGGTLIGQLATTRQVLGGDPRQTILQAWHADGLPAWETVLPTEGGREWRVALTTAWRPDGSSIAVDLRREMDLCHETVLVDPGVPDHPSRLLADFEAQLDCGAHRPAWSPDGRRLAMVRSRGDACWPWEPGETACAGDLVVYDLGDAEPAGPLPEPRVVATDVHAYAQPLWLPDGSGLVVARRLLSGREPGVEIVMVPADGSAPRVIATPPTWDPDLRWAVPGRSLLVRIGRLEEQWLLPETADVVLLDLASGSQTPVAEGVVAAALQP